MKLYFSKKKSIIIGYQGSEGSFSEMAARKLAERCELKNVTYLPLITSESVFMSLQQKQIKYALVATRNSIGGNVEETMIEIMNNQLQLKRAAVYPIHQCLFKKSGDIPDENIDKIVSHVQALRQTAEYRKLHFPNARAVEEEDTAIAAEKLANGELEPSCAVICSYEAGIKNGLFLYEKNIEDRADNRTEFRLFCLPPKKNLTKEAFNDSITRDSLFVEYLTKAVIFAILAAALWLITTMGGDVWTKLLTITGYLLACYLLYKKGKQYINANALVGYWKYYSAPDKSVDESQQYHIPRVVEIRSSQGIFKLDIYTPNGGRGRIDVVGYPAYSFETGPSTGEFTYKYHSRRRQGLELSGFAILDWYKKHPWSKIKKMTGNYFGIKSLEPGQFTFYRITREEFNDINHSQFLNN